MTSKTLLTSHRCKISYSTQHLGKCIPDFTELTIAGLFASQAFSRFSVSPDFAYSGRLQCRFPNCRGIRATLAVVTYALVPMVKTCQK